MGLEYLRDPFLTTLPGVLSCIQISNPSGGLEYLGEGLEYLGKGGLEYLGEGLGYLDCHPLSHHIPWYTT